MLTSKLFSIRVDCLRQVLVVRPKGNHSYSRFIHKLFLILVPISCSTWEIWTPVWWRGLAEMLDYEYGNRISWICVCLKEEDRSWLEFNLWYTCRYFCSYLMRKRIIIKEICKCLRIIKVVFEFYFHVRLLIDRINCQQCNQVDKWCLSCSK